MNNCLLDELDKSNVKILFKHKLVKLDTLNACRMTFIDGHNDAKTSTFDFVVGCDGAHSQFRYHLQKTMRMDYSQKYIDMQYLSCISRQVRTLTTSFQLMPTIYISGPDTTLC